MVKGGFVKRGFVKGGFVRHGFVKGGFVKHGFVKGGFLKGGFVKHGFVKGRFVKGGFCRILLVFTWRHKIVKPKLARLAKFLLSPAEKTTKNISFHKFPARQHPLCSNYSILNFRDFRST